VYKVLRNFGELWSIFGEHKFSTVDISDTSCRSAAIFGMVRGLANGHLLPEFGELWSSFLGAKQFDRGYLRHFLWSSFLGAKQFDRGYLRHFLSQHNQNLTPLGVLMHSRS